MTAVTPRAILLGPVLAWGLSRALLMGGYVLAQSMRSERPPLPPGDHLCQVGACTFGAFAPWALPAVGLLLGAIALWLLVREREGDDAAGWAVGLWLAAPTAMSLQSSPGLAFASGLVFTALWLAGRGEAVGAALALAAAVVLGPWAGAAALAAAALLWQRGARAWWVPLGSLVVLAFLLQANVQLSLPGEVAVTPGLAPAAAIARVQLFFWLLPLAAAFLFLVTERDWPLALGALAQAVFAAAVGAPWLGRATGASSGWALWGKLAVRSPMAGGGAFVLLSLFQGLVLHFYAHRYFFT